MRLSEKHGVNPTIPHCFFCGEAKNEIILAGRLPKDEPAPKNMVWDKNPCDKCEKHMEAGIVLISVRNGEKGDNPYRTGGWVVMKEEAFRRIFKNCDDAISKRVAFVPDEVWDMIGLPRA
jgi:hypothetical protein